MTSVDTLLANRVTTPAGIVAGEVPVWNGSAWVRSSVTKMSASGITGLGYQQIQRVALGSASTVTFSSIPATFISLKILWKASSNTASEANLQIQFNSDTAANYDWSIDEALNAVANVGGATPTAFSIVGEVGNTGSMYVGEITIPEYLHTNVGKSVFGTYTGTATNRRVGVAGGRWSGTAPVNRIDLTAGGGVFFPGTAFTLYGIS